MQQHLLSLVYGLHFVSQGESQLRADGNIQNMSVQKQAEMCRTHRINHVMDAVLPHNQEGIAYKMIYLSLLAASW